MDIGLMDQVTGEFAAYLSEVSDGDLTLATPCERWTVSELIQHATDRNIAVGQAARPESVPPGVTISPALCDPVHGSCAMREQAYRDSARYMTDALADAGDAQSEFSLHLASTLIHTWDLSSAIQFEFDRPDARALECALTAIRQLPSNARGSGQPFGDVVSFPGISAIEELLLLSGRSPAWRAPLT